MKKADLDFTIQLSHKAGKLLLNYQRKLFKRPLKLIHKGAAGLASEADLKSEELVLKSLQRHYPKHLILSEEDAYTRRLKIDGPKNNEYMWLIDPLDGTNNFLNGLPFFAVSLALVKGNEPIIGVVHNPLLGETFCALKGKGAWLSRKIGSQTLTKKLNGVKSSQPLKNCLISTNLGSQRHSADLIRRFPEVRAFRRLGSAALELCYVASGILDAYWEYQLQPWDTAAGGLICREAGVLITDLSGQEYHPFQGQVLAAHSPLYDDLKEILANRSPLPV